MDIKDQRDKFLAFSFAAADLSLEISADYNVVFSAGAATTLFRQDQGELEGLSFLDQFTGSERGLVQQILDTAQPGSRFGPLLIRPASESGAANCVVLSGYKLPYGNDHVFLSLSGIKSASLSSNFSARLDAETQLPDKDSFTDIAAGTLKLGEEVGQDLTLTFLNLPSPEVLKEAWGEVKASDFLSHTGALLRAYAINDSTARFSGTKFGLIHGTDIDGTAISSHLVETSQRLNPYGFPLEVEQQTIRIEHGLNEGDKLRALHHTINCFVEEDSQPQLIQSMSGAIDKMMHETGQRIRQLRTALDERSLELEVQPVVDLKSQKPMQYEALVRFQNEKSPIEVVEFATGIGLISDVDLAVCKTAIDYIVAHPYADITLSVNISAQSIMSSIFNTSLVALVNREGLDASRLIFEITDSCTIDDLESLNNAIQTLRRLGHKVALDDFDPGTESLRFLRHLDIDQLKFDGDYIRSLSDYPRERHILSAMTGLCHDLDILTVATRIEAPGHVGRLITLGVDAGQGYLFGKPLPLAHLILEAPAREQSSLASS